MTDCEEQSEEQTEIKLSFTKILASTLLTRSCEK